MSICMHACANVYVYASAAMRSSRHRKCKSARTRAPEDLESFSPNRNEAFGAAFFESDGT